MPTAPPLSQFNVNAPMVNGISQTPTGVALTSVGNNELLSTQLGNLQRSDNPLVQNAQQNARAFAAARGAGLSGSLYSDAATRAAYDQMVPIAQFDAGQYADVRDRNQDALNQQNIERMGNQTSVQVAGIGARAQHDALIEQARQFDINQQNRQQNREWELADQRAAARANQRSATFNTLLQAAFSDPSIWRDPEGVMGFFNTYSSNIDDMLAGLFPEYQEPGTAAPDTNPRPGYALPAGGTP